MTIEVQEVVAFNYLQPIQDYDDVSVSLDMNLLIQNVKSLTFYFRSPEECPFGRGNWILDIIDKNDALHCYKYPASMTKERFERFLKPLLDRLTTVKPKD